MTILAIGSRSYSDWLLAAAFLLASVVRAAPIGAQAKTTVDDPSRYAARRDRAYSRLGDNLLVAQSRWAPSPATAAGFSQDPTFYYFTGADHLTGAVLVLDGRTRRAEVFLSPPVPGSFIESVAPDQPLSAAERARALHVDGVAMWDGFAAYIEKRLVENPRLVIHVDAGGVEADFAGTVGSPLDSATALANQYVTWRSQLHRQWPNADVRLDTAIAPVLRAVKDSSEVAILRRVAAASAAALRAGLVRIGVGRRQREVEAAVVETCTRMGDGPSFWPWAMSGPNAAFPTPFTSFLDPHHLDRVMRAGEIVRYDLGCQVDHYMGDVGRTVPVSGSFTPDQTEVVDLLVAVYRAGLATLRDGAPARGLLRASMAEAARRQAAMRTTLGRHAATLISTPGSLPFWQWHGIGLDYAEPLPPVLRAGMVLDYEPIFVVDGQGFYMEDMILVTSTGYEILTSGLPSTAAEIQRAMRRPLDVAK